VPTADLHTFNPASVAQLAAALGIRRTGAYAFVAYETAAIDWDRLEPHGFEVEELGSQNGVNQYRTVNLIATRQTGRKPPPPYRKVKGRFFVSKLLTREALVFVTPERDDYVRDGLIRFLYRARANLTRARLTSAEMWDVVSTIARTTQTRVITNRSLLRNKRHEATISYKAESLADVYEHARDTDANVQGFDFCLATTDEELALRAGINRDGKLSFQAGSRELFLNVFVETVASTVKARADLLTNRARLRDTGVVRPLRLKFNEPLFQSSQNVQTFLNVLGRIRHGEFTLFHRNPYLHLSFFDFFDASEFDVIIEAADSLLIVPQFESSGSSLFRLCQKIFERFDEGVVTDAPDVVTSHTAVPEWDD
jgi:hypothetical protein